MTRQSTRRRPASVMNPLEIFPTIHRYRVPVDLASETLHALRREGRGETESIVFWGGRLLESDAEVHTIVVPKGAGVELRRTHVVVSASTMARIAELVNPPDFVLVGQVHTHEHDAFHSLVDDIHGFHSPGFLSIVVPHFASAGHMPMDTWAVFECLGDGHVRALRRKELGRRIVVDPGMRLHVTEIRDD